MADWDPEIDSPAVVAIIGAGPIGIEAALYARFLGYEVLLIDHGKVAGNVLKWGHMRMFSPFRHNSTSLGLAALAAQDSAYRPPAADALLTGADYANDYLVPLAKTDLIYDGVHVHSRILSISRIQSQRDDDTPGEERAGDEFRILIDSRSRGLWSARADIVIDTTGNQSSWRGLAPGGGAVLALPETMEQVQSAWIDVNGKQADVVRGKEVLLVGSGVTAASTAIAIQEMIVSNPGTTLTWVTLPDENGKPSVRTPMARVQGGMSQEIGRIAELGNRLLEGRTPGVVPIAAWGVERIDRAESGKLTATMLTGFEETLARTCDVVLSATGGKPQWDFVEGLRIQRCGETDAPVGVAKLLKEHKELDEIRWSGDSLMTTEPNYYVLGAKSFGLRNDFSLQIGFSQIRALFALIGGRSDLDLYARASKF